MYRKNWQSPREFTILMGRYSRLTLPTFVFSPRFRLDPPFQYRVNILRAHLFPGPELRTPTMQHDSLDQSAASRRSFIKTSALGVATGAVAGTLGMMQSVHAGADDTIRIGLVGCGGRGTGAAVQVL